MTVEHATFTLERDYDAPPAAVFAAWARPEAKSRWFVGPDEWVAKTLEQDFRVGGEERVSGGQPGGKVFHYAARYQDTVPDERIVTTYEMHMEDTRISVSVATVEFTPSGGGTRLVCTESGAFLDGHDKVEYRERGTTELLDNLGRALAGGGAVQ
ncbi:SRPBCC family protein [Actinosynnema sp. NPDC023794]